ncbi:MAG: flagellar biosynthesis protein FlhF [Lautropia sp.]
MSTMTFLGRTTREAMALAKSRFGADVEIVESRQTADGVELTAIVQGVPLQRRHLQPQVATTRTPAATERRGDGREAARAALRPQPMSTVSFESFVRDRQEQQPLRVSRAPGRFPASPGKPAAAAATAAEAPAAAGAGRVGPRVAAARALGATTAAAAGRAAAELAQPAAPPELLDELKSIKRFIAGQLETVRWFDAARRRPSQMRLLRRMLASQFSPGLARSLCDLLPMDFDDGEADRWLAQTLSRTIASFAGDDELVTPSGPATMLFDHGGVFALTGPTGVGKTTTIAKIAARYASQHGAQQVALITADVYRIGAQEQLRSFGQMLGVPVHVAHDQAALRDLLGLFGDRRLVLIDTAGVGQRDPRVEQLLDALALDPIQRIVVLNAGLQSAVLQDVATAYRAADSAGVLLSKIDEAIHLGASLDCLIRQRLPLLGIADGQRVPEDFHAPDLDALAEAALGSADSVGQDDELANAEMRFILEGAGV